MSTGDGGAPWRLERADFGRLIERLAELGYRPIGPTVRDGAIVYDEIGSASELPIGWTDRQEAGQYRLERRTDEALFGFNVGPHSWKKYLFPAHERLWTARRTERAFEVRAEPPDPRPFAFLAVRACEIAAIAVQDRVFLGAYPDPSYRARREGALIIAVECGQSGRTCFCVSMGTGPRIEHGYDLALTEILAEGAHYFVLRVGTARGARVLEGLPVRPAEPAELATARTLLDRTAAAMGRSMDTDGIRDLLLGRPEHPRWQIVARRCLSCTNCTLACPTCFCSTSEEVPELDGAKVERWRRWDSCFNLSFTELHATQVRKSPSARYRQWLTHKLASWYDQFGSSGCVGCGRCITWCPVGIDLTEEVAALRAPPSAAPPGATP
jgi:formate hydrogenlyase subunit 6/NADH:ubiquinone oxidoreductase subunit I